MKIQLSLSHYGGKVLFSSPTQVGLFWYLFERIQLLN